VFAEGLGVDPFPSLTLCQPAETRTNIDDERLFYVREGRRCGERPDESREAVAERVQREDREDEGDREDNSGLN